MNIDETVKQLRWLSENDEWVFAAETMAKAADLIESLQAQLKLEHGGALAAAENCLRLQGEVNDLQARLAEAKRRAEKAVRDMKIIADGEIETCYFCTQHNCHDCYYYLYGKEDCYRCNGFEWRGDAEEGEKL